MGRRCSVCTHQAREAIEAAIHGGASLAEAAARHSPITKSALGRHMADHVVPVRCEAVSDLSTPLAAPLGRVRERLAPVQPVSLEPAVGNVVAFPGVASTPVETAVVDQEKATPLALAILLQHGYNSDQIAHRLGLDHAAMMTLLNELEQAYTRQATASNSTAIVGRLIFKTEYAIAELERHYQAATLQGRNRDARECRRMILVERRELRDLLRESGITRPVDPADLDSKPRRDMNDIYLAVKNSIEGIFEEVAPVPTAKARLIG